MMHGRKNIKKPVAYSQCYVTCPAPMNVEDNNCTKIIVTFLYILCAVYYSWLPVFH